MGDLVYWALLIGSFIAMCQTGEAVPFLLLLALGAAVLFFDRIAKIGN